MRKLLIAMAIVGMFSSNVLGSGLGGFASRWDTKDLDDTWGGGAILRIDLDQNLQLDIRGSYYEFKDSEEGVKATVEIIPIEAALMLKFPLDPQFNLYAGGGGGYYMADADVKFEGFTIDIDLDDEFGFFALGGIQVNLGDALSIFGEAKYTWLKYKKAKISAKQFPELGSETIDFDIKMDGLAINIGLLLRF